MNAAGWVALATAVAVAGPGGASRHRAGVLVGAGRLAVPPAGHPLAGPVRWLPRIVAGLAGAAVLALASSGRVLLATAAAAVAGAGWLLRRDAVNRKSAAARQADLRTALRVLAGELEAGAQAQSALAAAGEAAPRFSVPFAAAASAASRAADVGSPLVADDVTKPIGLAWRMGADTGVALAAVLGRVAADVGAEQEQWRLVESVLAGPRASALLLSGLPLVGVALGTAMGARPVSVLTGSTAGQALCCAGVLLDLAGVLWMRRILRRAGAT